MKHKNSAFLGFLGLVFLAIVGMTACSTHKNTFPNRAYHNVTCHYNVYWNGQQAMKSAEAELVKVAKDNYTARLPIYNYPDKTDLGSALPHLDRTIEKSSKAIFKHSMLIKGKEYVKTIDDAYLLMAKAHFYKQDYSNAARVLSYITHNFANANTYNEAAVLQARTSMRQGYFSSADEQLENLHYLATSKKNKKFNVIFNAAKAEYHLTAPEGDIAEAIEFINNTIAAHPKREFNARLHLILGEIYEEQGQQSDAQQQFKTVIKKSSTQDMVFCAQMHLASNYNGSPASRNAIMKQFKKMLGETKNQDYIDQIYYACSEIARIDHDDTLRKQYLAKSVAAYTNNNYQRTFSSLTLADLYFGENEYRKAQAYYDTAVLSIPKNYPDHDKIMAKSTVLKDLVTKLDEIDLQDSLQRIAKMSEGQRKAWVAKMIADYTEAERKAAAEEAERMLALQNASSYSNINVSQSNGKWYFYNQSLMTAGQQDFYRRWGNRKLEDNWFISNKTQISFDDMAVMNDPSLAKDSVEYDEDGNPIAKRETDPKKEAYYLQDLPLTPGAIDTSNKIIQDNLFAVGYIYQDMLNDMKRASGSFEDILKRYPDCEYALPSMYLLYVIYSNANDSRANKYKEILLSKYADTDYARLIQDPDYYQKLAEREKELEFKYEQVYEDFNNKKWKAVVKASDEAIPLCVEEDLKARYSYLRAVAAGQVFNQDTLITGLKNVITQFPKTEVAGLARIHLSTFDVKKIQNVLSQNDTTTTSVESLMQSDKKVSPFVYKPDEMHYVILLVRTSNLPVQTVKQNLANFNQTFFSLQRFNISSFYVDNKQQMVTIAKFNNAETAMDYYNILVKNELFAGEIEKGTITAYPMSATNYTTYYNNEGARASYEEYLKENYFKDKE